MQLGLPARVFTRFRPALHFNVQATSLRHAHRHQRLLHRSTALRQEKSDPAAHRNFYKSHGRALFKALTLAFFSYQVFYWAWIALQAEEMKDQKDYEIRALEGEVKLLEEGRKSHRPSSLDAASESGAGGDSQGKRLLEDVKRS